MSWQGVWPKHQNVITHNSLLFLLITDPPNLVIAKPLPASDLIGALEVLGQTHRQLGVCSSHVYSEVSVCFHLQHNSPSWVQHSVRGIDNSEHVQREWLSDWQKFFKLWSGRNGFKTEETGNILVKKKRLWDEV